MLPKIHGMQVRKCAVPSSLWDMCERCFYSELVKGLINAYHCTQGVLEGPLYHTDGCNLQFCIRTGTRELYVTEGSTVVGETDDPPVEEPAPAPTPETREWKVGDKVRLLPWKSTVHNRHTFYASKAQSDCVGSVGRLHRVDSLDEEDKTITILLPPMKDLSLWWPRDAIELVSPAEELKTYYDLGRSVQIGDRVLIVERPGGIPSEESVKGKVVRINRVEPDTNCYEFRLPSGNYWFGALEHLAPLDQ